jgi:hypothetical protein
MENQEEKKKSLWQAAAVNRIFCKALYIDTHPVDTQPLSIQYLNVWNAIVLYSSRYSRL